MDDPDIDPGVEEAGRTLRRVIGWGGVLIFSLMVWAAVFWVIGQGMERRQGCVDGPEATSASASCPSLDEG
jgi:hypothetical protein